MLSGKDSGDPENGRGQISTIRPQKKKIANQTNSLKY